MTIDIQRNGPLKTVFYLSFDSRDVGPFDTPQEAVDWAYNEIGRWVMKIMYTPWLQEERKE